MVGIYILVYRVGCTVVHTVVHTVGHTVGHTVVHTVGCSVGHTVVHRVGCSVGPPREQGATEGWNTSGQDKRLVLMKHYHSGSEI